MTFWNARAEFPKEGLSRCLSGGKLGNWLAPSSTRPILPWAESAAVFIRCHCRQNRRQPVNIDFLCREPEFLSRRSLDPDSGFSRKADFACELGNVHRGQSKTEEMEKLFADCQVIGKRHRLGIATAKYNGVRLRPIPKESLPELLNELGRLRSTLVRKGNLDQAAIPLTVLV